MQVHLFQNQNPPNNNTNNNNHDIYNFTTLRQKIQSHNEN